MKKRKNPNISYNENVLYADDKPLKVSEINLYENIIVKRDTNYDAYTAIMFKNPVSSFDSDYIESATIDLFHFNKKWDSVFDESSYNDDIVKEIISMHRKGESLQDIVDYIKFISPYIEISDDPDLLDNISKIVINTYEPMVIVRFAISKSSGSKILNILSMITSPKFRKHGLLVYVIKYVLNKFTLNKINFGAVTSEGKLIKEYFIYKKIVDVISSNPKKRRNPIDKSLLYHSTSIGGFVSAIMEDKLIPTLGIDLYAHFGKKTLPRISFTRNKNFIYKNTLNRDEKKAITIVLDRDKIVNNYKLAPFSHPKFNRQVDGGRGAEDEEILINKELKNLKKYIVKIIFNNDVLIKEYSSMPEADILARNEIVDFRFIPNIIVGEGEDQHFNNDELAPYIKEFCENNGILFELKIKPNPVTSKRKKENLASGYQIPRKLKRPHERQPLRARRKA